MQHYTRASCLVLALACLSTGCVFNQVSYWEPTEIVKDGVFGTQERETKIARYTSIGVFRNSVDITDKDQNGNKLSVSIDRPGLSDNGLEALKTLPELADEIGHSIQGTQGIDSALSADSGVEAALIEKVDN